MKSILVIGASGFIGSQVLEVLPAGCDGYGTYLTNPDVHVAGCVMYPLDVTDAATVDALLRMLQPDIVVLVCGSQDIEAIAKHDDVAEAARTVHVDGTRNIVTACQTGGSRLVYVSTDCVFDGTKRRFTEHDLPAPFNEYGAMKLAGERIVQEAQIDCVIIRISLTYGWRKHPKQFHNYALRVLDSLWAGEQQYPAATNLFNTPIEVTAAAAAIVRIALSMCRGVFHVASRERVSRHKFAVALAKGFGVDAECIIPTTDTTGLRPPNSCLAVERAEQELSWSFERLRVGIGEMKRNRRRARVSEGRFVSFVGPTAHCTQ